MDKPLTRKLIDMARRIPTRLIPGNHDEELGAHLTNAALPNHVQPIMIVKPFARNGFFYCHGHESDPPSKYLGIIPAFWDRNVEKTPGDVRKANITPEFLMLANVVHSIALTKYLPEMEQVYHQQYKGIVLGHTHLPVIQQGPELPYLLNSGDMRDSASFIVLDGSLFQLMTWNYGSKKWEVKSTLKV
jgi:UDP-2,3-diacylglucosamine pyrophosphatase LpxH